MKRRAFITAATAAGLGAAGGLVYVSHMRGVAHHEDAVRRIWRHGESAYGGAAAPRELVRYATLAPSSHNTQCWKFRLRERGVSILPVRSCASSSTGSASMAARQPGWGTDCSRARPGPSLPGWLGRLMFEAVFSEQAENDKYARHVRSAAGIAVFVSEVDDKAHWIEAGRCFQRLASRDATWRLSQLGRRVGRKAAVRRRSVIRALRRLLPCSKACAFAASP